MHRVALLPFLLFTCLFGIAVSSAQSSEPCQTPPVHVRQDTLSISGLYDGNHENTSLVSDGQVFMAISESETSASFLLSGAKPGLKSFEILEDEALVCSGEFQLINISAVIDKSDLRRGEHASIEISVSGLVDYDEPVTISINNLSPGQLSLNAGNSQTWTIMPGANPATTVPVTGKRPGPFQVEIQLQVSDSDETPSEPETPGDSIVKPKPTPEDLKEGEKPEEEKSKEEGCGSVHGKVTDLTGRALRQIVVFIDGQCALCPPKKPLGELTITNDCKSFEPSWAVVPAGATITVENTADFDCDITPFQATYFKDGSHFDEVLGPGESASFEATEYRESEQGLPQDYGLMDKIHKNIDMKIFVAPNECYCTVDEDGNYAIGELEPGTYTLKVYSYPQRSYTPTATVEIEPDSEVKCDFVLRKDQPPAGKQ